MHIFTLDSMMRVDPNYYEVQSLNRDISR